MQLFGVLGSVSVGLDVGLCVFVEVVSVVGGVGVFFGEKVVVTVSVMRTVLVAITVMIETAFDWRGKSPHCPKPIWHPSSQ